MNDLVEYEWRVLEVLAGTRDDTDIGPGAALWAAVEALRGRGLIDRGMVSPKPTPAGWAALQARQRPHGD